MLQLNGDSDEAKDALSSFLGHNSLDARYLHEVYIDTKSPSVRSRSLSPMSSDSSTHTFSSGFVSSSPILTTSTSEIGLQPSNYLNFVPYSKDLGICKTPLLTQSASVHPRQEHQTNIYNDNIDQHRLHHIEAQKQQQNEISNSLKMFAMLASYKNENDYIRQRDMQVDDIMQDFYCNGYVTDDSNGFHLEEAPFQKQYSPNYNDHNSCSLYGMKFNKNLGDNGLNDTNCGINGNTNIAALSSHYLNQSLRMFNLPSYSAYYSSGITSSHHQYAATVAAATAAAVANIDFNNQNIKKPQKRYGNAKIDKYSAVKHCVFCENNNEPEAVVKSHAVRDSLGRVLCPKLRTYICPICKASGDKAHTVKYCPQKPIITMEDAVKAESLRLAKNSYFKQGMKT
ncbi:protein nanos [Eurosta solidaginis]|uniref:protein nanos n=1 Tax=Eurosta solidaginis TaxID=178769 RepID=UPI0035317B3F